MPSDSDAPTIALLHYTGPGHIGGIERLIGAQIEALRKLGYGVRLIVGRGPLEPGVDTRIVPLVNPMHPSLKEVEGDDGLETLVQRLCSDIRSALIGCSQCWVHNAFTVHLNPALTAAVFRISERLTEISWSAWCSDVSATSSFAGSHDRTVNHLELSSATLRWITISESRRTELAAVYHLDPAGIRVVRPPLDVLTWLGIGADGRLIAESLRFDEVSTLVFVPAKLLPHKNLMRAIEIGEVLVHHSPAPLVMISGAPSPHQTQLSAELRVELEKEIELRGVTHVVRQLPSLLGRSLDHSTVRDLMLLSDVVLLTSAEEGFGVPLREAAALRVPVLCTDIPVFRETGGTWASYFSQSAPAVSVATQILAIASRPENVARRQAMASARRFFEQVREVAAQS